LFANAAEAIFFASLLGLENVQDPEHICIEIAKIPKKKIKTKRE